jgi:hypothetical protein
MDVWTKGRMDRLRDGQMYRQTDRWTDGINYIIILLTNYFTN